MRGRLHAAIALLAAFQVMSLPLSWLLSALLPQSGFRSLVEGAGVRWLLGGYSEHMAGEPLAWLLSAAAAFGAARGSGLFRKAGRDKNGIRTALAVFAAVCAICILLTAVPHAPLLNAVGELHPSSFVRALPWLLCFTLWACSAAYTAAVESRPVENILGESCAGIAAAAPVVALYMVAAVDLHIIIYVVGW